jgi:PEP-CTERM/exosortase A-associated glycosyltransferase
MRVLHILDHSIPLHSGYTFRTAAILREQRALGWETFHLTSPKHTASGPDEENVDGLHFFRTHWQPFGIAKLPAIGEWFLMKALEVRLEEIVAKVRPDIVHAHSPVLNALPAIRVARRHGIPIVYEIRAFWEDAAVDHGTTREGGMRYRLTRGLETRAMLRADHVTTICDGLCGDIVGRGIPPSKVTVIPNAVDISAFTFRCARDEELRRKWGLEGATVVGFLGSYYAYEGLDLLIDSVPGIARARADVRVLLVGGGPQEAALKARAQRLGVADKVLFVGRVPHAEVQRYYSLVDVLAYPRHPMRLTDLVTPLKPLEAMAQGQLLVASDVGGHRELIRDGVTGVLFKAGSADALTDAVLRLLAQPERWEGIRERARRFVEEERTWAGSVSRYVPVFEQLRLQAAA